MICHYSEEEEDDDDEHAIHREALLAAEVCAPAFTGWVRPGKGGRGLPTALYPLGSAHAWLQTQAWIYED